MHATLWFLPLILSTYYDLRVVQLNNRRNEYFLPCFRVENVWYTPLHAIKYVTDKMHFLCNRASSLCVVGVVLLGRTCIACTRVQTMSICPNLHHTTLEAPGTQLLAMLLCGFFWGSNRNHYYLLLVLVMRPLATSISMYVRVPTEIQ